MSLGPQRSYRAVAAKFGVTKRAVTKFAAANDWSERLDQIEAEAREKSDQELAETVQEMRTRHLKTLRAMSTRALAAMKEYPLTSAMEAIKAAEITIKLERLVAGEAMNRTTVRVEEATQREMDELLRAEPENEDSSEAEPG
jgi:hypothetical protein